MLKNKAAERYELVEARISAYREYKDILFLFPSRTSGATFAITELSEGKYWVLQFKSNKIISPQIISHLEEGLNRQQIISILLRYAGEKGFLKKNTASMSAKDLATLLLNKQGLQLGVFQRLFPKLKDAATEDFVDVAGMKIMNTDSVKNAESVLKIIARAAEIVKDAGFGHLVYGDVFLMGSAMKQNVAADYDRKTDQVRFKVGKENDSQMLHNFIHELGHRQYYKFKINEAENHQKYNEVIDGRVRLKIGDVVKDPKDGVEYKVVSFSLERGKWKYKVTFGDNSKGTAGEFIENWEKTYGETEPKNVFDVTHYAKSNETEYWPEVFATALTTKNPELLAWVHKVTK